MKSCLVLLFVFISRFALAQPPLSGIVPIQTANGTEPVLAKNIPPVMSQDTLGICYAFAASTMLTSENCRKMKTDCSKIQDSDIFSPVSLANYGRFHPEKDEEGNTVDYTPEPRYVGGGHVANVMVFVNEVSESSASESCVSLDKILSKVGGAKGPGTTSQLEIWNNMESYYTKYKKLEKKCPKCATDYFATAQGQINQDFCLKKSNDEMLKAFAQDTYEEFLSRLLTPKECNRASGRVYAENSENLNIKQLPEGEKNKSNYKEAIAQVIKVLQDGRPIALSNLCLQEKVPKNFDKCENAHALVITGYRKVCSSPTKCTDAVKIQNSWGQGWQDSLKSDSWVEAKTLLDKSTYGDGFLTWFEDKPKEK